MAAQTLLLMVIDEETGETVNDGDTVTDFRGNELVMVRPTRARLYGKSGKILFRRPGGSEMEYYDRVCNLVVLGLLTCGCDHASVATFGHRLTCTETEPS